MKIKAFTLTPSLRWTIKRSGLFIKYLSVHLLLWHSALRPFGSIPPHPHPHPPPPPHS